MVAGGQGDHGVEKLKQNWIGHVVSGLITAIPVLAIVWSLSAHLATIDGRLKDLEDMNARVVTLESELQDVKVQVQELKDELQFQRKINDLEQPKPSVKLQRESISDLPSAYRSVP